MKVELSIKDDKELRDLIKDMIKGQVVSIVRDEVKATINEQVAKSLSVAMEPLVRRAIYDNCSASYIEKQVEKGIGSILTKTVKDDIFNRAMELLNRDNDAIEKVVKAQIRKIKVQIGGIP